VATGTAIITFPAWAPGLLFATAAAGTFSMLAGSTYFIKRHWNEISPAVRRGSARLLQFAEGLVGLGRETVKNLAYSRIAQPSRKPPTRQEDGVVSIEPRTTSRSESSRDVVA
jgi:hypothetical protein